MVLRMLMALASAGLVVAPAPVFGQTSAAPQAAAPSAAVAPVIVAGRRLAPAELESRSAACQAAIEDPYVRELVGAGMGVYARTRAPRNPDYSAPPVVLPDAPLPEVKSLRQRGLRGLSQAAEGADAQAYAYAGAIAECVKPGRRLGDSRGGSLGYEAEGFWSRMSSPLNPHASYRSRADQIFPAVRAQIKANDRTLPLAFALFDQGRYALALDAFKVAHKKLRDVDGGDEAALMIGKIYLYALRDKSDPVEAVKWLKWSAASYFNPTRHTMRFDPIRPDNTTAIGEAAMILAGLYAEGHGPIARNPDEARKYLERAVEVGYVPASKELGDIYYEGRDTPRDLDKAFRHYKVAATLAYAPAAVMLARMYAQGEAPGGVNQTLAAAWNNEAAKFEDPEALYAMAVAYDRGEGVAADPDRALGFYKIAAVNGNAAAQAAVGTYFYAGEAVPRNLEIARGWFQEGALRGDADGMFNLAAMMARGEGGDADLVMAWGWLKIAERLGHARAGAAITALEGRFTDADRAGVEALKSAVN